MRRPLIDPLIIWHVQSAIRGWSKYVVITVAIVGAGALWLTFVSPSPTTTSSERPESTKLSVGKSSFSQLLLRGNNRQLIEESMQLKTDDLLPETIRLSNLDKIVQISERLIELNPDPNSPASQYAIESKQKALVQKFLLLMQLDSVTELDLIEIRDMAFQYKDDEKDGNKSFVAVANFLSKFAKASINDQSIQLQPNEFDDEFAYAAEMNTQNKSMADTLKQFVKFVGAKYGWDTAQPFVRQFVDSMSDSTNSAVSAMVAELKIILDSSEKELINVIDTIDSQSTIAADRLVQQLQEKLSSEKDVSEKLLAEALDRTANLASINHLEHAKIAMNVVSARMNSASDAIHEKFDLLNRQLNSVGSAYDMSSFVDIDGLPISLHESKPKAWLLFFGSRHIEPTDIQYSMQLVKLFQHQMSRNVIQIAFVFVHEGTWEDTTFTARLKSIENSMKFVDIWLLNRKEQKAEGKDTCPVDSTPFLLLLDENFRISILNPSTNELEKYAAKFK